MNAKVISVQDASFDGRDGQKVAAVTLTFEVDGQRKTLASYIPPVVTAALQWKPGQEVEVEEYTDKNGKPRFKTPQAGKGGGYKGLSFDEQLQLRTLEQDGLDRRTALMQAVALHTTGPELLSGETILESAGKYLSWLRATRRGQAFHFTESPLTGGGAAASPDRIPPSPGEAAPTSGPSEGQSNASVGKETPAGPEASGEEESKLGNGEGPADSSSSAHCLHLLADGSSAWENAPRTGWRKCSRCGLAEKGAA